MFQTVTLKKLTSRSDYGKETFSSTDYYGRLLSDFVEIYDISVREVMHDGRCIYLEPDADPETTDTLTYSGKDYRILAVKECMNQRNVRDHWELVIR